MRSPLRATPHGQAGKDEVERELFLLITEITNEINWQLRERRITRAELADRMGVSAGRISQVLSGDENLTMRTLASLAMALDARFEVQLRPRELAAASRDQTPPAISTAEPASADADGSTAVVAARRRSRRRTGQM
jgi:transcriptional regulator with XRE-family HTH domain